MPEFTETPSCITDGCETPSSLSSTATGHFWNFTTYYCAECYEKLAHGEDSKIDASRIIVERNLDKGPIPLTGS